jgi:phage/plasmid-like protein (TIGR03299 family)
MAHNIAEINGQNAIAYIDDTPWHGLGQRMQLAGVAKDRLVDQALDAAQMRFNVGSLPLYLADGTEIKGHKASVRFADDGSVAATLGIVGDGYTHVQNDEACGLLRVLAEEFNCVPSAAGVLGDGSRCWMLMRLADSKITPVAGDDVNGYFLLHWGHDGNMSVQGLGTGIRVVCQNTLNMAVTGRKAWIAIRHTSGAGARLDEAAKLVRTLMTTLEKTGQTFASMAAKRLDAGQLDAFIARIIPATDSKTATVSPIIVARRDTVSKLVFYGRGAAMANQAVDTADGSASLWAAYNAVTEYFDHVRTAEAQSDSGLRRAQESAVFGGNAEIKAAALVEAQRLLAA